MQWNLWQSDIFFFSFGHCTTACVCMGLIIMVNFVNSLCLLWSMIHLSISVWAYLYSCLGEQTHRNTHKKTLMECVGLGIFSLFFSYVWHHPHNFLYHFMLSKSAFCLFSLFTALFILHLLFLLFFYLICNFTLHYSKLTCITGLQMLKKYSFKRIWSLSSPTHVHVLI